MQNRIQISIPKPCESNINTMSVSQNGYFCDSCQKEVIDFRNFSNKEIQNYFLNIGNKKVCGAFRTTQITLPNYKSTNWFLGTFTKMSFFVFLMLQKLDSEAQTQLKQSSIQTEIKKEGESKSQISDSTKNVITVSGVVLFGNNEDTFNAICKDSSIKSFISISGNILQKTVDKDGKFNLTVDTSISKKLVFSYPFYIPRTIELDKLTNLNNLIVVLYTEINFASALTGIAGGAHAIYPRKFWIRRLWRKIFK